MTFRFPVFHQIHHDKSIFSEMGLKFLLRRTAMRKQVDNFEQFINHSSTLQDFFTHRISQAYPLLHLFADKRLNARQRLAAMKYDLSRAQEIFSVELFARLARFEKIKLAQLDQWQIYLNRNDVISDEGFWAVSLRTDDSAEYLYTLSFVFRPNREIFIASLQGRHGEDAREAVRHITKALHGLRPQQLMVIVLQNLAQHWNMDTLTAVARRHQVKYRFKLKKKITMDYDAFWQENGASRTADENWRLPLIPQRKAIADIPSKKRSLYQRRYAMLDQLAETLQAA